MQFELLPDDSEKVSIYFFRLACRVGGRKSQDVVASEQLAGRNLGRDDRARSLDLLFPDLPAFYCVDV
jgi:hypothetical protein